MRRYEWMKEWKDELEEWKDELEEWKDELEDVNEWMSEWTGLTNCKLWRKYPGKVACR